jgi:hypothetical protein
MGLDTVRQNAARLHGEPHVSSNIGRFGRRNEGADAIRIGYLRLHARMPIHSIATKQP